ncbi:MAG: hypothetical protein L0Z68_08975, partial [Gammaproteobacteria bacterium]|nr:hypothetical protein [Gammaproteobacteria bacterium]
MELKNNIFGFTSLASLLFFSGSGHVFGADVECAVAQTIDTSQWSPPSPDPSGAEYLSSTGNLMISDGEVDETMQGITFYQGANMFEATPVGSLVDTWETTTFPPNPPSFSNEPVGVAYNPSNQHLFISDDNTDDVFEIDPNGDGLYGTPDDVVTTTDAAGFGATDPEGLAYGAGAVWIADGINDEIYKIVLGANGVLGGGDDQITHFDTGFTGIGNTDGIGYGPSGHLYIVGPDPNDTVYELTLAGMLVRTIGIAAFNAKNLAGVAVGPGNRLYLADRRVDNDSDPNENDGRVYVCDPPPLPTGNQPPIVSAGPDKFIVLPNNSVQLDGTVTDDGLPNPPALTTMTWIQVSGPTGGTATFGTPNAEDTTASFDLEGSYVLR